MAVIECTLKQRDELIIPIGNERYTFKRDDHGRLTALVWIAGHVKAFLARSDIYRLVQDGPPASEVNIAAETLAAIAAEPNPAKPAATKAKGK